MVYYTLYMCVWGLALSFELRSRRIDPLDHQPSLTYVCILEDSFKHVPSCALMAHSTSESLMNTVSIVFQIFSFQLVDSMLLCGGAAAGAAS